MCLRLKSVQWCLVVAAIVVVSLSLQLLLLRI
jgi:hypothetical protein